MEPPISSTHVPGDSPGIVRSAHCRQTPFPSPFASAGVVARRAAVVLPAPPRGTRGLRDIAADALGLGVALERSPPPCLSRRAVDLRLRSVVFAVADRFGLAGSPNVRRHGSHRPDRWRNDPSRTAKPPPSITRRSNCPNWGRLRGSAPRPGSSISPSTNAPTAAAGRALVGRSWTGGSLRAGPAVSSSRLDRAGVGQAWRGLSRTVDSMLASDKLAASARCTRSERAGVDLKLSRLTLQRSGNASVRPGRAAVGLSPPATATAPIRRPAVCRASLV